MCVLVSNENFSLDMWTLALDFRLDCQEDGANAHATSSATKTSQCTPGTE